MGQMVHIHGGIKVDETVKEILVIVGGVLVCGGFWTFVQFLISRYDGKKKAMDELRSAVSKLQSSMDENSHEMQLQNEALMALAQDRIVYLGEEFLKQGWISISDHASLVRMADSYKALGGNSIVTDIMNEVDKLPRKNKGGK